MAILVTHTESKSLPEDLVNVLYRKYEKSEQTSSKLFVRVGEFMHPVHKNFRLYMSINTSLLVTGLDGFFVSMCNKIVLILVLICRIVFLNFPGLHDFYDDKNITTFILIANLNDVTCIHTIIHDGRIFF